VADVTRCEGAARLGTVRLELGPRPSVRELLGALGDALVRSRLVADSIELTSQPDGFVLWAECGIDDEDALARVVRELTESGARRAARHVGASTYRRPCALAS
jgi:hypothetical protein